MSYLSVFSPCTYEKVIERSRFIANCAHAESEEQARTFIAGIRAEHSLATHNCFAFVADRKGNLLRFSDDGEPQGTAGMPMLEVLKNKKLFETVAVVTRYFGGIKLGAGGLTRAYASSAAEALERAEICEYAVCVEVTIAVNYPEVNALTRFLEGENVLNREFAEKASFTVAVREENVDDFCARCNDILIGRAEILRGKSYFSPFPLDK